MKEITFDGEMPFPNLNAKIYREIYSIEVWLRRILYAALVAQHGNKWFDAIPSEVSAELKKKLAMSKGKIFLDCGTSSNAIWLTTFEELRRLLTISDTWTVVEELTDYKKDSFSHQTDAIREIRNAVGHNRAATKDTFVNFHRIADDIKEGIEIFKKFIFHDIDAQLKHVVPPDDNIIDIVPGYFRRKCYEIYEKQFSGMPWLGESKYYYTIFSMSAHLQGRKVDIRELLKAYKKYGDVIMACMIDIEEDGYTIIWPKNASQDLHLGIIDTFFNTEDYVLTDKEYSAQGVKYVCDPKIWFHYSHGK